MKKKDFLERIRQCGYTEKTFAELVERSEGAIKKWKDGTVPKWAILILEYIELADLVQGKGLVRKP